VGSILSRALLDSSIVLAEADSLALKPEQSAAISVITLGELRAGVRLARDDSARTARQARLAAIRDAFEPLPIDESVAEHYGDLLATARSARRASKATDLLIIATAAATGRVLHTLDERQARLAQLAGVSVHDDRRS
jgi:predicted nucleic acid-binding protein